MEKIIAIVPAAGLKPAGLGKNKAFADVGGLPSGTVYENVG